MRLTTRLILILGGNVLAVVALYMLISNQQRQDLLRDAMIRDADFLATTLQVVSEDALRTDRLGSLDRALRTALADEEVVAAAVLDPAGRVLAGGAEDMRCLEAYLRPLLATGGEGAGWAACDEPLYWRAMPLPAPGALLAVAQREITLNRSVAAALRRQLFLLLGLMATLALIIVAVLRRQLARPLGQIVSALHTLGETGRPPRLRFRRSAGELVLLADRFNQVAEQLEGHRARQEREAEERIALERRLREAERYAVIGRLSGNVAHELASPLSVITMRIDSLKATPGLPDPARRQAEAMSSAARQVTEIIQGLLHIARRQGIVFDPVELVQLVRTLIEEMTSYLEDEGVQLELELPAAPVQLRGQETLLRHALRNLVRNAVHALRRQPGERRVRVRVAATDQEAQLLVEDSGPGIAPEHLVQVFDPFFSTKPAGEGLGLGLPISRAIVEEHGGELSLENLPEGGVRARIVLPLPDPERANG